MTTTNSGLLVSQSRLHRDCFERVGLVVNIDPFQKGCGEEMRAIGPRCGLWADRKRQMQRTMKKLGRIGRVWLEQKLFRLCKAMFSAWNPTPTSSMMRRRASVLSIFCSALVLSFVNAGKWFLKLKSFRYFSITNARLRVWRDCSRALGQDAWSQVFKSHLSLTGSPSAWDTLTSAGNEACNISGTCHTVTLPSDEWDSVF